VSTPSRLELARDIHDGIAQDLVALGYELDLLLGKSESTVESRSEIRTLRFRVDELISKVRRDMYELRDPQALTLQEELSVATFHLRIRSIRYSTFNSERFEIYRN
jgi:signal transduction histidine kinase